MKFKTTWFLLAVFSALGAYLYFVDRPREQALQAAKEKEGVLFGEFDPARASEITADGFQGRIRIEKGEKGTWSVLAPVADAADDGKLRSFLEDLKALRAEKEVAKAGSDLRPFGLDAPTLVINVDGRAGRLAIGSETPSGEGRYVQKGSGAVHVVSSSALAGLLVKSDDVRSKEIVRGFPWDRLRSVQITGATTVKLSKVQGKWRGESPVNFDADPDAAEAVAEKLRWGRIKSFLSLSPSETEPHLVKGVTVTLTSDGGAEPSVIKLAEVDGAVLGITKGRNAVFVVEKDVLSGLRKSPEELRRKKPILTKTWSAEKLEITARGLTVGYEKIEGAWRREGATVRAEEREALTALLQVLEEENARQVIGAPGASTRYGLDAPAATIELTDSQNGAQVLLLGKKGSLHYARSGDEGPVYAVGASYLSRVSELLKQTTAAPRGSNNAKPDGSAAKR